MNPLRVAAKSCKFIVGLTLLALLSTSALAGSGPITLLNPAPSDASQFGSALALSPDGGVAVVSSDISGSVAAAVYLFQYAGGAWNTTPLISLLDPVGSVVQDDGFGAAVAVSAINNNSVILAVGSPNGGLVNLSPVSYGVVYLFQCMLNSPAGCTLLALITDPAAGPAQSQTFGSALAISQNGNTLLVGAWGTLGPGGPGVGNAIEPLVGAAYVYTATGGTWPLSPSVTATLSEYAPTCAKLSQSLGIIDCDEFGFAVALSGDGTQALVGAPGAVVSGNPFEGSAFAFQAYSGQWQTTPVTTLYNADGTACTDLPFATCDLYGSAVALSADGSTAAVGAPNALGNGSIAVGATPSWNFGDVSVFHQLVTGSWAGVTTPVFIFTNPNENAGEISFEANQAVNNYGSTVALSNDGTTVLVGSASAQGLAAGGGVLNGLIDSYTCNFSASPNCVNTPVLILNQGIVDQLPHGFASGVAMSTDAAVVLTGAPGTPSSAVNFNGTAYLFGTPGAQTALSLALSAAPNPVAPNSDLSYQFIATNTSNLLSANALTLTETLPMGVIYSSTNAAGGTCTFSKGTVTCTLARLAAGATWQPSIAAFALGPPASVQASATLTAGSATAEAFVTTVIDVPPTANSGQLGVSEGAATSGALSATPGSLAALTYSLTQPAHGTVVLNNAGTGAFTYTPNAGYVGSDSFTFNVSDGLWTSSAATVSITVSAAQVSLSYTGPNAVSVTPGQQLTYTATVSGSGAVPADNLVMNVSVPAGLTLVSHSITSGTCTSGTSVNCTLPTLSSGSWVLTVIISVDSADTSGMVLASTAGLTLSNGTSTPASVNASVTVAAGSTGGASGGGGLDWVEIMALGVLCGFGWRRRYSAAGKLLS